MVFDIVWIYIFNIRKFEKLSILILILKLCDYLNKIIIGKFIFIISDFLTW